MDRLVSEPLDPSWTDEAYEALDQLGSHEKQKASLQAGKATRKRHLVPVSHHRTDSSQGVQLSLRQEEGLAARTVRPKQ